MYFASTDAIQSGNPIMVSPDVQQSTRALYPEMTSRALLVVASQLTNLNFADCGDVEYFQR